LIQDLIFIALGLVGLFYGADFLVKGAARLATHFGIPPLVVGLTVVAYGTSMPEQIVSLTAALNGKSDIAIGNVVGSNIFNVAFILALTAFVFPIKIDSQLVRRDIPFMIGVSFVAYFLAWQGREISRLDGALLFAGVLAFTFGSYYLSLREKDEIKAEAQEFDELAGLITENVNVLLEVGRTLFGVAVLIFGARLTLDGSVGIAEELGISQTIIGLTLVSAGTSLPELATSVVAAFRKEPDIAAGNIVGSNIFNLLSILGLTAIIQPIGVASEYIRYDFPIMIMIAVLLLPLVWKQRMERWAGAVLLVLYVAYVIFLATR
jgi:cation:H+ antiporter